MNAIFGELRGVLGRRPCPRGWAHLCHLLETRPEHQVRDALVPYLGQALERWPEALRVAPPGWMLRAGMGRPPAAWALVRAVRISMMTFSTAHQAERFASADILRDISIIDIAPLGPSASMMLESLCADDRAVSLHTLRVQDVSTSPVRLAGRLASARLERLQALRLSHARQDQRALEALVEASWFSGLERLDLHSNALDDRSARVLSACRFDRLEHLDLSRNRITDSGARVLMNAPGLRDLKTLLLRQNHIDQRLERILSPVSSGFA